MYLDNQEVALSFPNQQYSHKTLGMEPKESYNHNLIENPTITSRSNAYKVMSNSHHNDVSENNSHGNLLENLEMNGVRSCMNHIGGNENCSSKRKRDWLSTLRTPSQNSAKNCVNSLITSVKVSNGSSLPPGWEQYMDLKSGETYYVNWKTRTKHLRIQCPEVQKCLAEAMASSQRACDRANNLHQDEHTSNSSTERWLSKMTATASALANGAKDTTTPKSPNTPTIQTHPSDLMHFSMAPNQNHATPDLLGSLMRKNVDRPSSMCQFDDRNPNRGDQQVQPLTTVVCGVCNMFVMLSSHSCPNCNTVILGSSPSDHIASSTTST